MLQINQLIQKAISEVLSQQIEIPDSVFITVNRVQVSNDLQNAKVFISAIPTDKTKFAVGFLVKNKGLVRKELGKKVKQIKFTPELRFYPDFTEAKAYELEELMDQGNGGVSKR